MTSKRVIVLDESCAHLHDAVARFAPVSVFRRNQGFRCASQLAAAELRQMLAERALLGQAIYVAQSFGGFTALLLAAQHPHSLAGLLLLDPSHPRQGPEALAILADLPSTEALERLRLFLAGFGPAWEESCREVSAIRSLGNLPIRILAGGKFHLPITLPHDVQARLLRSRHAMLAEYGQLSSESVFEIVTSAGHDVAGQAPASVLTALRRMLGDD